MNVFYRFIIKVLMPVSLLMSFYAVALTESGTVIKNQAGATYRDSAGIDRSTTSNLVETVVQPVAAMTLTFDQSKLGAAGGQVTFTHVLTNTGNVTDTYDLDIVPPGTVISGASIYPDVSPNDGVADAGAAAIDPNSDIIGPLAPGESYSFVIVTDIDAAAALNQSDSLTITATSQQVNVNGVPVANGMVGNETNTDTVTVTDLPIIDITKAISADNGAAPSGPYTVTFTYTNIGITDMNPANTNGIILKDELPEGMRFNGGVNWSVSGTQISPSNNTAGGSGSDGTSDLSFTTCINNPISCPTRDIVEFTMDGLASNESATISFEVMIDNGAPAGTVYNFGVYGFDEDNSGQVDNSELESTDTNTVPFRINAEYSVIANNGGCTPGTDSNCDGNDDTNHETVNVPSAKQGERVYFTNYIWNTSNAEDTFNITYETSTFPAGTSFFLYKSDGVTPLVDTDNDSNPDTGRIPASGQTCRIYQVTDVNGNCGYKVVLVATLPPNATGGPFEVVKRATSSNDISKSNTVIDQLSAIELSTVDLTNNFRAETATTTEDSCDAADDNCGFGAGAEASAVTTNSVEPGKTTRFTLYVTNTSAAADGYKLEYSDNDFNAGDLPADWTVVFKDATDNVISGIPVLAPDAAVLVYADVTVPASAGSTTQSIYFKVTSDTTGATDTKHDAVTVDNSGLCVGSSNNLAGVTHVGGSKVYVHTLTNNSNDAVGPITIGVVNSIAGFTSVIYEDTDNSGDLTNADVAITSITSIAGQSTKLLLVKVFVPANAQEGVTNLTTLTLTSPCGVIEIIDSTRVSNTNMEVKKLQAIDTTCNGVADGPYLTTQLSVEPGRCVLYQLIAKNVGIKDALNVSISDITPAYTSFIVAGGVPSITAGTVNNIVNGSSGTITGTVGTVIPGDTVTLTFGIKIDD
ncbi:hypothetical protein [Photobacterium angustum]|uniref:DUF11 domain-containing protein n=1 Tax=Photobacterium angustum TaxID=661 RepID=A0A2S7VL59_PHOAN|nr:hypothetical protein [Photobacterium angustum]PQJ62893.1 hypothetical protein BTO08_22080 [Photobacterium angustum]